MFNKRVHLLVKRILMINAVSLGFRIGTIEVFFFLDLTSLGKMYRREDTNLSAARHLSHRNEDIKDHRLLTE